MRKILPLKWAKVGALQVLDLKKSCEKFFPAAEIKSAPVSSVSFNKIHVGAKQKIVKQYLRNDQMLVTAYLFLAGNSGIFLAS